MPRWDPPSGRRATVERLLQVLTALRERHGGWLARRVLVSRVTEYATAGADKATRDKLVERDFTALRALGFQIDSRISPTADDGGAEDRLTPSRWRLPVDLTPEQRTLLTWVTTTAQGDGEPSALSAPDLPSRWTIDAVSLLIGSVPSALDLVHAALSGRRALVVEVRGRQTPVAPVHLVARGNRWFLVVRFEGSEKCYAYRLDRLSVLRLGPPLPAHPARVPDLERVLNPMSWDRHPPVDVEVRSRVEDGPFVQRLLPALTVQPAGSEAILRGTVTNSEALVDAVLRSVGRAWLTAPHELVETVRARALAHLGAGADGTDAVVTDGPRP